MAMKAALYGSKCTRRQSHRILEGMTIAGHAVGANKGYAYIEVNTHWLSNGLKQPSKPPKTRVLGKIY